MKLEEFIKLCATTYVEEQAGKKPGSMLFADRTNGFAMVSAEISCGTARPEVVTEAADLLRVLVDADRMLLLIPLINSDTNAMELLCSFETTTTVRHYMSPLLLDREKRLVSVGEAVPYNRDHGGTLRGLMFPAPAAQGEA